MSITIDLGQTLESALKAKAEAVGLTLEQYAVKLLESDADRESSYQPRTEAFLNAIRPLKGKLGPIPEGALDPTLMYGEC